MLADSLGALGLRVVAVQESVLDSPALLQRGATVDVSVKAAASLPGVQRTGHECTRAQPFDSGAAPMYIDHTHVPLANWSSQLRVSLSWSESTTAHVPFCIFASQQVAACLIISSAVSCSAIQLVGLPAMSLVADIMTPSPQITL